MERMKDFKAEVDRLVGEYIVELKEENRILKEKNKKIDKLKIRVYENLHKDIWKEYQKFCDENHI